MKIFDRYLRAEIHEKELPDVIDLGRYYIKDNDNMLEMTYSNFATKQYINQEILLEKNVSIQNVFIDIYIDVDKSENDVFDVIPLVKRIKNKLSLNEFEEFLIEKMFHIQEIIRNPHYLLDRESVKTNVSLAKKILPKSYEYLSSHTEDWIQKSVTGFKPHRIFSEFLDQNYDVYENQLLLSFIQRCIIYLHSRIIEIQDLSNFFQVYSNLLSKRDDNNGWYKKIQRNLTLIGSVYEDESLVQNPTRKSKQVILSEIEHILISIKNRMQNFLQSPYFERLRKNINRTIVLKNTNVIVNHKHYRYLKMLWIELEKIRPEKNEKQKNEYEQKVIIGVRKYALSLIAYVIKEYFGYEINGSYKSFIGKHEKYPELFVSEEKDGTISIVLGSSDKVEFVVVSNKPEIDQEFEHKLMKQNRYILYYSDNTASIGKRLIPISPLDVDSAERIGLLFKEYFLKKYISNLNKEYKLVPSVANYLPDQEFSFLKFDKSAFTYRFIKMPFGDIEKQLNIKNQLITDKLTSVRKFTRHQKDIYKEDIKAFFADLRNNINKTEDNFYCFECKSPLEPREIASFEHLICNKCNSKVINNNNKIHLTNTKFEDLTKNEFGMDYINLKGVNQ